MMNLTYNSIKTNSLEAFPPLELGFSLAEKIERQHHNWIEDGTYHQVKLTVIFMVSMVYAILKPITLHTLRAIIEGVDNYVQSSLEQNIEGDRPKTIEAPNPAIIEVEIPQENLGQELTEENFTRRQLLMLAKTFGVKNYSRKSKSEIFEALKMQGNIPEKL
jgi:hypothetical protein